MSRAAHAASPVWSEQRLEADRQIAIRAFREERMKEPLAKYLRVFETYRDAFTRLLRTTGDLRDLPQTALDVLASDAMCETMRYLPGPPISLDDLRVLAEAPSISSNALRADPSLAKRIADMVLLGLDRKRFPWVAENREPTPQERVFAILASSAMLASRRVETDRRNDGKQVQEQHVQATLIDHGLQEVGRRSVETTADAPRCGQFCMESLLGTRKADLIVGLWDRRVMPIECKVSNSATNSIKRLNNDAAVKAETWRQDFGKEQVVPAAVLSGVYNLRNLQDAQQRGLALFWAHSLVDMTAFIDATTRGRP